MKIIDLLNKIANGEDVPKKIKLKGTIYEYDKEEIDYIDKSCENSNYWGYLSNYLKNLGFEHLTDGVEILDNKKIEERLPIFEDGDTFDTRLALNQERRMINKILDKINEVE